MDTLAVSSDGEKKDLKGSRIPEFIEALEKMRKIHESKNEDYSSESNPFSNFDTSEYGLKLFPIPRDGAFAWPIFCKLARLSNLLNSNNRLPNNESIEDTFIDIANYLLLWRADYLRRDNQKINTTTTNFQHCDARIGDHKCVLLYGHGCDHVFWNL